MLDLANEQGVKGSFAQELPNPPYNFQVDDAPAASISIGMNAGADNGEPMKLVQPKDDQRQ